MTFEKGVEPKVFRAIQHVNMEELAKCTEQEIRPVLPCLVRMGLISPLDTSKKCMNMKLTILTIVSGMELVNSIVALLSIDFHKLEIDVKKEQQLRQKGNTLLNDSVLIGNLSNTSMALEYERSDMTRRLSILLGELLYIHSQIQEGAEINEQESYIKSSELFDNDIFAEELSDIICIALAELPTTLSMCTLVETLLHVHNGPAIICRIVANFPDSFREVTTYLIQTGEKQEENISSVVRTSAISLICKMNPSQALSIRNKCVDLCRMPALAITLSLEQNKNVCDDVDGDMVAFISGLLLGNDQTIRNWIALFIRTGQKRKGEVSSNALQQLRDELLKRLQKIIEASSEGELPDSMVVQASALLRLYCALRGIAAIKFQDDEVNYIVQLLTSHPNPTPAGVRFVSIGLCMLIACPSLISLPEHERKNIEWVQWLVKEEAYFETASGVTASFGEMLLLMAIHFHSNQLSAICDLVCATLGMKIAIRHNNMTRMKQVFTQEIFTEQVVTAHAVKVPVTNSLNANMTGFLPIHCIHQLLKSRAFAKHNVNIKKWIYKQICTSVSPLHPVLRMLVEVYVNSIILPNTKNSEHTNKPLTENEIRKVFQSSIFGQYFDQKQSIFTMDFDLSSEYQDVVVDNTSLTPQLLLLYYLLLYEDCRLNNAYILAAVEQTGTKIKKYTPEFMSELPIKYLLHHAQKDQSSYSGLFGPLLKLLATHFPHLTLVEDWLDDMAIQTEYKPTHISEISVIEAFSEIENNPLKCAKLLQNLLKKEAIDIWPFVEIFTQHAKNFLGDNVPRYLQDLYKEVWFRLNTVLPRRLWVLTVKNLVEDCSSLSRIDVAEDPLQIMRCDERVFRCAPMYAVVLRVLRASLASSRSQLMQHFLSNLKFEQSGQVMNESDREEMRRACIAAQVFDYPPEGVRKCIISTNIAETSVTIDGIRFVVDSGKVNRMSYNTNVGVNKLSECNISQDSAKQRAGRAGRTGPGTCFRLYSEEDLKSFEPFTPAEIHQVPLDSLLLHMISLGLHDIANFPFLEKPTSRSLEESMEKLKFIGALELDKECLKLTELGDSLSQLPVDLTIGKMLILSTVFGNINSVLALASLMSIQSPLTQQAQRDLQARELRKPFESDHGDPLTLLNYYKEWLNVKQSYTPAKHHSKRDGVSSKVWARKRCLEEQRFYEATKLIEQFREILQEAELLPKLSEAGLSSGERSIRLGELKQLKSMRYRMRNEEKRQNRKQLKYEMYDTAEADEDGGKMDIRDVEFRITNDFKKLQRLLNEASADTHKDLVLLKLILASGLYPQVAVEDEFNSSKTVLERLYHTKNKNYVFLRPDSYFASNPEVLELHNDDVEVPPSGYFSKRSISRKHQILIYQTILETKKVYLVNAMRMPALQTLLLLGKTIAANETLTKFVVDDFLMFDAPYFGQGKALLLKALALRRVWKDKLQSKLRDPTNTKIDQREIFYFTEDLIAYMTTEVSYNVKRLLPADLKDIFSHDCRIFENEKISENNKNPFCKDYNITKNFELGGINVTENLVYGCLLQEEWAYVIEQEIANTEFVCKHCKKSRLGSTLFGNMRHESFCSKRSDETAQKPEETTEEVVIQPNSKLYHCNVCEKDLMLTPESAAIQMLIETCSETDLDKTIPGRQWALQEVRSLVCSYLHQAFIADTTLCKLVHFQTYPSELIEIVVKGVPSMHICLDFLQELMQQPSLNKQIFGIQLLSHISLQYALPKSLNLCISALNLLYALLGGVSSAQRVKLFKPVLPALVRISEAFPPLTDDIINLLMQLAKICESQASLASHFDAHLGKSLEIASKESGELCDLTQRTFSEILDKAVLKAKIYKQD